MSVSKLGQFAVASRGLMVTIGIAILAALLCWVETRGVSSACHSYVAMCSQVEQMQKDAARIASLRTQPQRAAERERPNDELIAQVRRALQAARISEERWIGNEPAIGVRISKTPYKKISTKLRFEGLEMRELVIFVHALIDRDQTLSISAVRLTESNDETSVRWNVDLTATYLIYSPSSRSLTEAS
jgi:hypothetical protein